MNEQSQTKYREVLRLEGRVFGPEKTEEALVEKRSGSTKPVAKVDSKVF